MNTYNENMRAAIVSSLQNQNSTQKEIKSKLNAAMFTLYHAEGGSITAQAKLKEAMGSLEYKAEVKQQIVANSNASNNQLKSANQANDYLKQSVSNAAVCAANVQIAANAVTRLASDVGSIFSIINAADFDTDIYIQAEEVRELINNTAYGAEFTSQLAMETSMLTAEVSSATVLNESKTTNSNMNTLTKIVTDEFSTASQVMAADYTALAAANAKEKEAEGNLKYYTVDAKAVVNAYDSMNKELNQQLKVITGASDTNFSVQFNKILNPFYDTNPVKEYYLFVVKESKSGIFSISNAENLLINGEHQYITVTLPDSDTKTSKNLENVLTGTLVSLENDSITTRINYMNLGDGENLKDSDGDDITLGTGYVVFLMAVYTDAYKKSINNFSDFLSAPSSSFTLTSQLTAVENSTINVSPLKEKNKTDNDIKSEQDFTVFLNQFLADSQNDTNTAAKSGYNYKVTFSAEENSAQKVQYRVMLLPVYKGITQDLLTKNALQSFLNELSSLDAISNQYDPQIAALQSQLSQVELEQQQAALEKNAKGQKEYSQKSQSLSADIEKLKRQKANLLKNQSTSGSEKPGFFFNLPLAEEVPVGSFIPAKQDNSSNNKNAAKDATNWIAYLGSDTTDNFGNMLVDGSKYIAVVLSYAIENNSKTKEIKNALSDFSAATPFTYKETV